MGDVHHRPSARCWSLLLVHAVLLWLLAAAAVAVAQSVASESEASAEIRVGAEQRAALIVELDQALPRIEAGVVGIDATKHFQSFIAPKDFGKGEDLWGEKAGSLLLLLVSACLSQTQQKGAT